MLALDVVNTWDYNATGKLEVVTVSATSYPDLFWGLRVRVNPSSLLLSYLRITIRDILLKSTHDLQRRTRGLSCLQAPPCSTSTGQLGLSLVLSLQNMNLECLTVQASYMAAKQAV